MEVAMVVMVVLLVMMTMVVKVGDTHLGNSLESLVGEWKFIGKEAPVGH